MSTPKTAAEGDRERFEEIRAHYDEYGFDGPTELDHERNGIIGFLLDAYDRLNVENEHLRDTDRDRDVELERLTAECDRLGAAGTEIGESWRRRFEEAEQPQDAQPERDSPAPDLWWSFTGGADTCYLNHDDSGSYRECCMRAGLAYALEVRDQQVRTETQPERDADTRAIDAMIMASVRGDSGAMALAFDNVRKRWIGRIAKLDAREAKAGDER